MKKILFILTLFIITTNCFAQDVVGDRVIAKQSLFIRDWWIDSVKNDTSNLDGSTRTLMTANAIYDFVNGRTLGGGGGGSGTVTSVGMTVPSFLSVSGSPITTSGTLAVSLSGTALPAINGGTGQTSFTVGDLLYASTTTALSKLAAGTSTYVLTSNGAGVAPSWQAIPADNLVVQRAGEVSGSVQIWFTRNDSLFLKDLKGSTYIGVTTSADSTNIVSLLQADYGDITVGASTWTIDNDVVTFAKFQNITQARLLGRYTASTGDMQEISIGSGLSLDAGTGVLSATGSGSGDVTKVGTPVNNQLGVWTGDGTIEGDANLTFASSTLNIGVAGASTGILTQSGVTSGTITFQPAAAAGTYTLTWPTTDGNSGEFLQTNGSGVLTWAAGGGGITVGTTTITSGTNTRILYNNSGVVGEYTVTGTGTTAVLATTPSLTSVTLAAGTASAGTGPLYFTSGTNLTTPVSGAFEFDGTAFYSSTASGRGVSPSEMIAIIDNDFTISDVNTAQNVFPSGYDVWTLQGSTTYEFEGAYYVTSGATSHSVGISFALAGGASITSIMYTSMGQIGSTISSTTQTTQAVATNANTTMFGAAAAAQQLITFKGYIRMNAGGTVTPQLTFSAAPGGTNLVKANSYIKFNPIGSNTMTSIGNVN